MPQSDTHAAPNAHAIHKSTPSPTANGAHEGVATQQHKTGLPQLNTHDFAPQLVWLALTFAFLYFMMSRVALPRIADAIERRKGQISSDLDTARNLQKDAEKAETQYMAALADAKNKAHAIAQESKEALNVKNEARRKQVEGRINAKLQEAEQRIGAARTAAMKEVNAIASSTTKEIVRRLIGKDTTKAELSKAMKAAQRQTEI